MKTSTAAKILSTLLLLALAACQRAERAPSPQSSSHLLESDEAEMAGKGMDSRAAPAPPEVAPLSSDIFRSAAASYNPPDSTKRFIRTAEMRFRVQDAVQATLRVEDIALQNGGFVLDNDLHSEVQFRDEIPVSADSLLEKTSVVFSNSVVIRVPAGKLDTTLRAIGRLADFLDYRRIHARDVWLELLEQDLAQKREQQFQQEIPTGGQDKAADRLAAAQSRRDSRAGADRARVETLKIEDAIRYSTVTLDLYQRAQMQYRMLPKEKPVAAFRPGFGIQLWEGIVQGWQTLRALFLGIVRNWSVLLFLVLIAWVLYRVWWRRG